MKDTVFSSKKTLNVRGKIIDLETPAIMGIINITPDSFYAGSRTELNVIETKAGNMLEEGATILDLGGYSSRPGAEHISVEEEINRIIPGLKIIVKSFPSAIVSVDTFRAQVAKVALEEGAGMINDISGGTLDAQMFDVVANYQVPYILMHMKGTPQTMTKENKYENLLDELLDYFINKVTLLRKKGIKDIIVDPGFGFAKDITQNYHLLKHLDLLRVLGLPILAGISRKSMIYRRLNITADQSLNGSMVLQTIALLNGASIIRVHDVKEMKEAIQLVGYLNYI